MEQIIYYIAVISIIAFAAAISGGTVRDVLLSKPVFWLVDPIYKKKHPQKV